MVGNHVKENIHENNDKFARSVALLYQRIGPCVTTCGLHSSSEILDVVLTHGGKGTGGAQWPCGRVLSQLLLHDVQLESIPADLFGVVCFFL